MKFFLKYLPAILILAALLITLTSSATTLRPLNLQQLATRATLIFHGQVTGNTVKQDEQSGYIATFTEFRIIELIKGKAGSTHTIKQLGGHLANTGITLRIHAVPEFETGKEYVVFLPEKSPVGFCSPLGLFQGSFPVSFANSEKLVNTARLADNPQAGLNTTITIPLAVRVDIPSQARLNDFINTVRAYNTP